MYFAATVFPMRSSLFAALAATALAGCLNLSSRPPRTSPSEPGFDAARAEASTRRFATGGASALGEALRTARTQPLRLASGHLVKLTPGDTAAMGFVAGQYPLRASELVVVAVPLRARADARAAWAELARVYAALAGPYVFPERTMLFAALPSDPVQSLARFLDGPDWPASAVTGVAMLGLDPNADAYLDAMLRERGIRRLAVPARPDAYTLALDTYTALWPQLFATGAPSDSLLAPDSLAALRADTVYRTSPQPRRGWGMHKY